VHNILHSTFFIYVLLTYLFPKLLTDYVTVLSVAHPTRNIKGQDDYQRMN